MTSPLDGLDARRCAPRPAAERGISNPPGQAALRYRIDTRAGFLARMLDRLATETLPDGPHAGRRPLADLEAEDLQDPTVAFLDAWAVVADILTFYQERIANEGYLRTAVERRSVLELAGLVGQELGPGVAASAFLAFTVDDAPGSPATVVVPRGTRVQSIPGQDELPQTFETEEDFVARAPLNAMPLRRGRPQSLPGAGELFLAGTGLRLAPGSLLLVVVGGVAAWIGRVSAAVEDADRQLTRARLEAPVGLTAPDLDGAEVQVFAFRESAGFFGRNAPRWGSLPASAVTRDDPYAGEESNWDRGRTIWTDAKQVPHFDGTDPERPAVYLDRNVEGVVAGSWVLFLGWTPGGQRAEGWRIVGHTEGSRADYGLSGPATGLALAWAGRDPDTGERTPFDVRQSTAYLRSERLEWADQPIESPFPDPVEDGSLAALTLDQGLEDEMLRAGQPVIVSGRLLSGETASRVGVLQRVDTADPAHTRLFFQQPLLPAPDDLEARFDRSTVAVHANVVVATHGETLEEVLGSGDGDRPHQRFRLSRPPLTYLSAPVPGGRQSTLRVRVDGVLWREVENLATEGPESQSYRVEIDDDGRATVLFGDGRNGARLPTGQENVAAVYRSGVGLPGLVGAGALQLLTTRPLGIREVTNPVPAAGAAAPDRLEQARANAPVAARTLGRIVSFSDFEDFARSFAGISKVQAVPIAGIHLTVAGEGGAPVEPGSALYRSLFEAIEAARLPGPPLSLASYQPVPFRVSARLVVDPRHRAEDVLARARAALLEAFSFDRRELEAPVYASDVLRVLQATPGVAGADLDALHAGGAPRLEQTLTAQPARFAAGRVLPAQMLLLPAGNVTLQARTA